MQNHVTPKNAETFKSDTHCYFLMHKKAFKKVLNDSFIYLSIVFFVKFVQKKFFKCCNSIVSEDKRVKIIPHITSTVWFSKS